MDNAEIVSGYEHKKGKYVEIDPDVLNSLRTESERALTIDVFVSQDTVDPSYFDGRLYYLLPDGKSAAESYSVIVSAMEREERCGVGHIIFSGKDQIVLIRPLQNVLHLAMLNYDSEIQPPKKAAAGINKRTGNAREVRLAQSLIREWSDDQFNLAQYTDVYQEKLRDLIDAKLDGKELVAPAEKSPTRTF